MKTLLKYPDEEVVFRVVTIGKADYSVRSVGMMSQAKMHLKMKLLFLLFVAFMGLANSSSIKAQLPGRQTEQLYGANQTIRVDPQPELGFFYPYYLFIPDNTKTDTAVYMLVEPNNTGTRTDDFTIHEQKAKSTLERGYPHQIACRMGIPLLMPVFPRLNSHPFLYTHALDRDSLLVKEEQLQRVDLQLVAMFRHAQNLLQEKGLIIHDRVLLDGFSASGKFVNRFAFLHPNYVKAVACGGMNSTPMLPYEKLDGEKLIYPIGVYDLKELTGSQFCFRKLKKVPQYIYQGSLDTNDTLPAPECFGPEEVRLIKKVLHEKMMPERWKAAKYWYQKAGIAAQFVIYDETYHEVKGEILYDIIRFFQANLGEKFVPIQPYVYSPVIGLKKAHIKEILLPDSPKISKIPASFPKDYHLIISIADWNSGQNYRQLNRFMAKAGFAFEVIDLESGKAIFKINKENCCIRLSTGNGDFQGYGVRLYQKQLELLKEGKEYTVRPINRSATYHWLVGGGVSFVWGYSGAPALLEELEALGAYWEGDVHIKGLKPDQRNSFFIETNSFTASVIDAFFAQAGSTFELFKDEHTNVTASIYKGGSYHTSDGKELYGFWVNLSDEEFGKIKPGVSYRLTPQRRGGESQWRIGEDVALTRPE
jgi:hypothetical protein